MAGIRKIKQRFIWCFRIKCLDLVEKEREGKKRRKLFDADVSQFKLKRIIARIKRTRHQMYIFTRVRISDLALNLRLSKQSPGKT